MTKMWKFVYKKNILFGKLKKNKNDQYKVRNLYKIKTTSLFYIYAFNLNFVGFNYKKKLYSTVKFKGKKHLSLRRS